MKNKIFALALIAVSLVSCTKNEDPTTAIKPKAVDVASVTVDLKTDSKSNPTGKTVNRGGLFAWISEIDITTKSNDFAYAPFMTPFTLTDAAVGAGVDATYNLDNVALGSNDFTVVTKTNSSEVLSFELTTQTPTARIALMKAKPIYALYGANINGFNVVKGANSLPSTMLTTQQGRAIGVFTLNPALTALGVTAKVSVAQSILIPALNTITVNGTTNASFVLNNVNSTDGKIVAFQVDMYDNNGHKFNTFTTTIQLIASTSINNIYTISESDITTNTVSEVFTAQPWDNQDGGGTIGN